MSYEISEGAPDIQFIKRRAAESHKSKPWPPRTEVAAFLARPAVSAKLPAGIRQTALKAGERAARLRLPEPVRRARFTGDHTCAQSSRLRTLDSASASSAAGSATRPAHRQATTRSGRTRTAPNSEIPRNWAHVSRGSNASPSRCPMRTASIGRSLARPMVSAARLQSSPFSPAIRRNRPGATKSFSARRSPDSSSIQA